MDFIAGVDGGGTKTKVVCASPEGKVLDTAVFGPFNMNSIGAERFSALLQELCAYLNGLGDCRALCIGSAGISNKEMTRIVETEMTRGGIENWNLVGDQVIALNGALSGEAGIALIAGTGSICFGKNGAGEYARSGGWGHLIDDEGSAYALGRDILRAVVRAADGRAPATALTELVAQRLGAPGVQPVIRFTYAPTTTKKEIAALAPLLDPALQQGDAAAQAIIAHAADELTQMAAAAMQPLGLQTGSMALLGSVLQKNETLRAAVITRLTAQFPTLTFPEPVGDAADGAAVMAENS